MLTIGDTYVRALHNTNHADQLIVVWYWSSLLIIVSEMIIKANMFFQKCLQNAMAYINT